MSTIRIRSLRRAVPTLITLLAASLLVAAEASAAPPVAESGPDVTVVPGTTGTDNAESPAREMR